MSVDSSNDFMQLMAGALQGLQEAYHRRPEALVVDKTEELGPYHVTTVSKPGEEFNNFSVRITVWPSAESIAKRSKSKKRSTVPSGALGILRGVLIPRNPAEAGWNVRSTFMSEMDETQELTDLAITLFDQDGLLQMRHKWWPSSSGDACAPPNPPIWADELDKGNLFVLDTILVSRPNRRAGVGRTLITALHAYLKWPVPVGIAENGPVPPSQPQGPLPEMGSQHPLSVIVTLPGEEPSLVAFLRICGFRRVGQTEYYASVASREHPCWRASEADPPRLPRLRVEDSDDAGADSDGESTLFGPPVPSVLRPLVSAVSSATSSKCSCVPLCHSMCRLLSPGQQGERKREQYRAISEACSAIPASHLSSKPTLHWIVAKANEYAYEAVVFAVMQLTLRSELDINLRDKVGNTALHVAAALGGIPAVVSALLAAGADASIRSKEGQTAAESAKQALRDSQSFHSAFQLKARPGRPDVEAMKLHAVDMLERAAAEASAATAADPANFDQAVSIAAFQKCPCQLCWEGVLSPRNIIRLHHEAETYLDLVNHSPELLHLPQGAKKKDAEAVLSAIVCCLSLGVVPKVSTLEAILFGRLCEGVARCVWLGPVGLLPNAPISVDMPWVTPYSAGAASPSGAGMRSHAVNTHPLRVPGRPAPGSAEMAPLVTSHISSLRGEACVTAQTRYRFSIDHLSRQICQFVSQVVGSGASRRGAADLIEHILRFVVQRAMGSSEVLGDGSLWELWDDEEFRNGSTGEMILAAPRCIGDLHLREVYQALSGKPYCDPKSAWGGDDDESSDDLWGGDDDESNDDL